MELKGLTTVEKHEAGAEYNVLCPVSGKPTDVFIKIKGADSKEWRNAKKNQTADILNAKAQGKEKELDFDAMDVNALVSITIGWTGITQDGDEYKFNKTNARKLYENSPNIVNQLIGFIAKQENFTKG
jgi:hypothetical protein